MYVGLHDGIAIVSGIDRFEQLANLPFRVHLISKLSDNRGGHISINIANYNRTLPNMELIIFK